MGPTLGHLLDSRPRPRITHTHNCLNRPSNNYQNPKPTIGQQAMKKIMKWFTVRQAEWAEQSSAALSIDWD